MPLRITAVPVDNSSNNNNSRIDLNTQSVISQSSTAALESDPDVTDRKHFHSTRVKADIPSVTSDPSPLCRWWYSLFFSGPEPWSPSLDVDPVCEGVVCFSQEVSRLSEMS